MNVENDTWKALHQLKLDGNLGSIDEVIRGLMKGMEKAIKR